MKIEESSLVGNFLAEFNSNSNELATSSKLADNSTVVTDYTMVPSETIQPDFNPRRGVDVFRNFVDHPVLIHHYLWDGVATGSLCLTQNLVRRYFSIAPAQFRAKVNNFYYVRAKIKLTFVVQGAAQCAGMLAFTAYPAPKSGLSTISAITAHDGRVNARIAPHVLIDPSKSETHELILPICTTTGYYDVTSASAGTDLNGSWEIWRRVMVPLITGTANTATVSVCVYMTLMEPEFYGLREAIALGGKEVVALAPPENTTKGSLSSIALGASKISSYVGEVFPVLSPVTTVVSGITGTAGRILQFLGFSKASATENRNVVINRTADNYSQIDGLSTAMVLGRSQLQSVSIAPGYIGGDLKEMSIDYIASIPAMSLQFSVAESVAAQTFVTSFPVHPYNTVSSNQVPPLKGLAGAHALWSGDLTYTFEFVASVFQRATFLIAWSPTNNTTPVSFSEALTYLKNTTVYVSGNTSVSITIPWSQPQPAMATDPVVGNTNGYVFVYVVNPLESNGSTDPIWVNVMAHSDNVAFMLPQMSLTWTAVEYRQYLQDSVDFTPTVVVPLGPPEDWVPNVPVSFGPPVDITNIAHAITGDRSVSVKDLISRMVPAMPISAQTTNNTLSVAPLQMITGYYNFMNHFNKAYVGYRGSTRLSLMTAVNSTVMAKYYPNPKSLTAITSWLTTAFSAAPLDLYAITLANTRVTSGVDVVVPMTILTNFYPGRNTGNGGSGSLTSAIGYNGHVEFTNIAAASDPLLLKGAGDDFVLAGFIGFPNHV